MDAKELDRKRQDILREINKLAVPVDPNQKKRDRLLNELERLDNMEHTRLETAIKETRKLLKDDLKVLDGMCKGTFSGALSVKAKVRVKLNVAPCTLETLESTCGVDIEFPKDRRKLALFNLDDEEELSCGDIVITKEARGLLPDLDKHLGKLEKLHKKILKRIKTEAKKRGVENEIDYFIDEVMNR